MDSGQSWRSLRFPLLPEWSGGEWEGSAEIEGGALVPTVRNGAEMEAADREEFAELQTILGKNAPKSLAEFQDLKYNNDAWKAFKAYTRAIQTGELSALADFSLYQETSREIEEKLVGLTTSNGIKTTGKSGHFIARVIGSIQQRRSGVDIQDIFSALTDKNAVIFPVKVYPSGNMSQKFRFGNVEVSVNPKTGNLIQTNPYRG